MEYMLIKRVITICNNRKLSALKLFFIEDKSSIDHNDTDLMEILNHRLREKTYIYHNDIIQNRLKYRISDFNSKIFMGS